MNSQLTEDKVRKVVREEITSSKDISEIKEEQKKQGVLLENLHAKFDKNIDLLTKQMTVKKKVDNHEERITDLETRYKAVKSVVALHSKQLAVK
ncbi:MAG: hypothetical protein AAB541_00785 [Patescibacteria group bacterium]